MRIFDYEVETTLSENERQNLMRITTSWKEEGRLEGREEVLVRLRQTLELLLTARFGERALDLIGRLPNLDHVSLDRLVDQLRAGAELSDLD